jgi:hypothetical protein
MHARGEVATTIIQGLGGLNRRGCVHMVVKQEGTRRRLMGRTK